MSASTEVRENRYLASEIKFLLCPERAEQVREWARLRLHPDPYADGDAGDQYRTTSLYFDTARFHVFRRKGSFRRSKYRIRRYGSSEVVFLERKLKTRGLVTKRRTIVGARELDLLHAGVPDPGWAGYWFHRRLALRGLNPVCQISYLRTARVAMTGYGPIRLTLDQDLQAVPLEGLGFRDEGPGVLLTRNQSILELKYRCAMPVLFKELVSEFGLMKEAISKYRLAAVTLGLVPVPTSKRLQKGLPQALYA